MADERKWSKNELKTWHVFNSRESRNTKKRDQNEGPETKIIGNGNDRKQNEWKIKKNGPKMN